LQGRPERCRPLLGNETSAARLPCAISVPNLMTDRGFWFGAIRAALNVRRLMYQSLIWLFVAGDSAGSLRTALDAEDLKGLADALVDSMRRNVELGRDFLGVQMLVDKKQAIELTRT
jgi:hypothetical protein